MFGSSTIPNVRSEHIIVETLGNEVLIYDLDNDQASCLNPTAALVWKYADGKTTVADIAKRMSSELGTPVEPGLVSYAVEQLARKHLLSAPIETHSSTRRLTRREFLVKAGIVGATVAIPVIVSIAAPKPAMAASCRASGQPCTSAGQCCSNSCNGFSQCS